MPRQALNVYNGKQKLVGSLTFPDGEGPFPLMIFSHGYGFNEIIINFDQLAERGVATYAFDFGGGAFDLRSDGDSRHMSVMTEARELDAVLKQLRQNPYVDTQRVLLCGHSQGGYVTTVTGIADQNLVCGLVLLSPAFVISTDAKNYFPRKRQPVLPIF